GGHGEGVRREVVEAGPEREVRQLEDHLEHLALEPGDRVLPAGRGAGCGGRRRAGAVVVRTPGTRRPLLAPAVAAGYRSPTGAARGVGHGLAHRVLVHTEPAGQLAGVLAAQRAVPDAGDDGRRGTQPGHPALRGVEVHPAQDGADGEGEERLAPFDELADGGLPALEAQVAGVQPAGLVGDEGLGGELLVLAEGTQRGLLPGLVTVEGEDDLSPA